MPKIPYIIAVTGPALGSFKSGMLAVIGYSLHQAGYTVYSNFPVSYPHKNLYDILNPDFLMSKLGDCALLVDDANLVPGFESRAPSSPANKLVSYIVQQCRKRNIFCIISTPRLMWGEIRLFDMASIHIYTDHDPDTDTVTLEITDMRSSRWRFYRRSFDARPLYKLYESYEVIQPGPPGAQITGRPSCKSCGSSQVTTTAAGVRRCRVCGSQEDVKVKRVR